MMEQRPFQRGPQTNLPIYEGQQDINAFLDSFERLAERYAFLDPFERLAERYAWSEMEKINRRYESLKGKAIWYVCSLPWVLTIIYYYNYSNIYITHYLINNYFKRFT